MFSHRIIEIGFSFLVAFLFLIVVSFISMRPVLHEVRYEARAEWDSFNRAVKERNDLVPPLLETLRGFEPGQGKLAAGLLESRGVSMRTQDQNALVSSVNETDSYLLQIEKLGKSNLELEKHPSFAGQWKAVVKASQRIHNRRKRYNDIARLYNRMLTPFPQNLLASLFGYVPLAIYKEAPTVAD
jgi:LemA protein